MTTYFLPSNTPQSDLLKTLLETPILPIRTMANVTLNTRAMEDEFARITRAVEESRIDTGRMRSSMSRNGKRVYLRADLARAIDRHIPDGLWAVVRADHEVFARPGKIAQEQYIRFELRSIADTKDFRAAHYEQEDAEDGVSEPDDEGGCPYGNPACDLDAGDPEGHGPCARLREGKSNIGRKALLAQNDALLAENQKMREACGAAHDQLAHLDTIEQERDLLRDLVRDLVKVGGTLQDHVADPNEPDAVTAMNTYHALRRKATEVVS